MTKILLRKQLAEIFRTYLYDAKKNKARSKGTVIAYFVLFALLMVGLLGGMFTFLAFTLRSTIVSVAFSVAFLLVLYLCILLMLTGKRFLLWLDALLPHVSIVWSWTWLRFLILFAILLMMILILYRLTTPRRPQHRVLPGAVFSAVAIVCMSILLSWLIGRSTKYSLVYGSLASVVILLFWFQAFGLLLILGVVLNHALEMTAPPNTET